MVINGGKTMRVIKLSKVGLWLGVLSGFLISACQVTPKHTAQVTPSVIVPSDVKSTTQMGATVYQYTLDNGLQVYIKPDEKSPMVMTQLWYQVGSANEPVGKGGVSHFLEHLMFKSAKGIDGATYDYIVGYFGGGRNAATSTHYTYYYHFLPANQYPLALEIEANRMRELQFDDDDIELERQVVKEERRQTVDDVPMMRAFEVFDRAIAPQLPSTRPVLGTMAEIDGLTQDDFYDWYDKWYHPNNAILVITGGVKLEEAKRQVARYFANKPKGSLPTERPNHHQTSHRGYHQFVDYQDVQVPTLVMGFNTPSLLTASYVNDAYALRLFADILAVGHSARLPKQLVRMRELLTDVSISYSPFTKEDTAFVITAVPRAGVSLQTAEAQILALMNEAMNDNIGEHELKRGQVGLTADLILTKDNINAQADMIALLALLGLPMDTFDKLPATLASITTDNIQAVAKKYLTQDNLTVMYVLPTAEKTDEK